MTELLGSSTTWIIWILFGLFFLVFLAMAPCHVIFLFPFVGLPLFWLLPMGYALPINLVIWLATPLLFLVIRRAMKKPAADGFLSLVGTQAEVVSGSETLHPGKCQVRAQGELWSAYCTDVLDTGEWVNITAVKGIGLVVERTENGSDTGNIGDVKKIASGERKNERHCH